MRREIFHLLVFSLVCFISLWRNDFGNFLAKNVYIEAELRGDVSIEGGSLYAKVNIINSEIDELEGKRAVLLIKGIKDFHGNMVKLKGDVRVSGGRIFIVSEANKIHFIKKFTFREYLIERYKETSGDFPYINTGTAFLFGEPREILKPEVRSGFLKAGLIHLLVISGLHIGMIALILSLLIPRPYGYYLSLAGVLFYIFLVVHREPPVLRAGIMFILFVLSLLTYRKVSGISLLLFSGTVILLIYPQFVNSYSFWLSFIATAYIILILRGLEGNFLKKSLFVSLSAFTGTAPLIASFSFISPLSILFSPLITPLVFLYSFFGVLSLFTFFFIKPLVDLYNLAGFIFIKTVSFFEGFSFVLTPNIGFYESVFVSCLGVFLLYILKDTFRKMVVLMFINFFLLLKALLI